MSSYKDPLTDKLNANIMLYFSNLYQAIKALFTVWFVNKEKAERRRQFMLDAINADEKMQLPFILWIWCYNKHLGKADRRLLYACLVFVLLGIIAVLIINKYHL